jgi:hypothetical protein
MQIVPVSQVLQPIGLALPRLSALKPSVDNYTTHLFQPCGDLEAGPFGVRNQDRALAQTQFRSFLESARELRANLAITPEYSMPWSVLVEAIEAGLKPRPGELWVLGCESLTYSDLGQQKNRLDPVAKVLFEPLAEQTGRFLDPLVYVFHAPKLANPAELQLVLLVQFKTHPMADQNHFEVSGMQRGTLVYSFDKHDDSIRLVSFICSDSLDLSDQVTAAIYKSALVIHIQMNPDPRHTAFRRYRETLLGFQGDETELICLNWASNITVSIKGARTTWSNIAGSAWYLRPDKFDDCDEALSHNHRHGLYYTWLKPSRFHALFFNYDPAIFVVEASKVSHFQVSGVSSRRRGPTLRKVLVWLAQTNSWVDQATANDGFAAIAHEAGGAEADIQVVAAQGPFAVERMLALSTGMAGIGQDWHTPKKLDSCIIESDEIIKRMTFCQDIAPAASSFRLARLRRCRELVRILKETALPAPIRDLADGFNLEWSNAHPQQNAKSVSGRYGTVVYAGEDINLGGVKAVYDRAADNLRRAANSDDESVEAQSRLVVWYREDGQVKAYVSGAISQIDKSDRDSPVDFTRTG